MPNSSNNDKAAFAWTIRPFTEDDILPVLGLYHSVYDHYKITGGMTEVDIRSWVSGPRMDPARQAVVAEVAPPSADSADSPFAPGTLLGWAILTYDDDPTISERSYFTNVLVHLAAERTSLPRELAGRLLDVARGFESSGELPAVNTVKVKAWSFEAIRYLRDLWLGTGLRDIRQFWTMARDLTEPVDEPAYVEGVNIRHFRSPADSEPLRVAFNDSFSDHWDHHPIPEDDWQHWISRPDFRPDLTVLAEDEDNLGTLGGFCVIMVPDEENRRRNLRQGWVELLGTTRAWRRKGLGRALLLHGLHSLRSAGLNRALLGVDATSLTGADRLYASVGFRITERQHSYEAPLNQL